VIVVDSNVLAARNLTGVTTRLAEQVEERDPLWIVPPLWRYELQNILAKAIWVRQITPEDALAAWRKASTQMVENEHEPGPEEVIELSGRYRITGYDANFIALAMEMGVMCIRP
jgi:predicted nucleic acid-binding protein